MATLRQHLNALNAHDLRAIASQLRVARRAGRSSDPWRAAIADAWDDAQQAQSHLLTASPQAQHALSRLARNDWLPSVLFFAEYGAVRRPRKADYAVPPWRKPQGAAEELYFLGLLHDPDGGPIERSTRLCLPGDLHEVVLQYLCSTPAREHDALLSGDSSTMDLTPMPYSAWILCHDIGQLLMLDSPSERAGTGRRHAATWLDRASIEPAQ